MASYAPYRVSLSPTLLLAVATQTYEGICSQFSSHRLLGVQEEVQLREQDFGNFQDLDGKRREKAERVRFGRFFYRSAPRRGRSSCCEPRSAHCSQNCHQPCSPPWSQPCPPPYCQPHLHVRSGHAPSHACS